MEFTMCLNIRLFPSFPNKKDFNKEIWHVTLTYTFRDAER